MIAVLLCAGFGTRLHPLTRDRPKPLLPVAGRPLLDYLMDSLLPLPGLRAIHLVTNARDHSSFLHWRLGWQPRLSAANIGLAVHNDGAEDNQRRLGACRDLALTLERASGWSGALVSAGDNIYRFPIDPLWNHFRMRSCHYVVVLPEADLAKRRTSGVARIGSNGRLMQLQEKPRHPQSRWICPPLYFLRPSAEPILQTLLNSRFPPPDAPGHFIADLCLREPVFVFKPSGDRLSVGNPDDYRHAQRRMQRSAVQPER